MKQLRPCTNLKVGFDPLIFMGMTSQLRDNRLVDVGVIQSSTVLLLRSRFL